MATQPEISPPDRIEPQAPPEAPVFEPPIEQPVPDRPEIVPDQPDHDQPSRSVPEMPQTD